MNETHETGAPGGSTQASAPPHRPRILVGALLTLATIIGVFAVLAVWANRQALNTDNWTRTSSQLLANKQIQTAVAAYSVNQLFSSGIVQTELNAVLPPSLRGLGGPAAAGLQQLAGQLAPRLLASPQLQAAWAQANRAAHTVLLRIINGGGSLASTSGGVVTLNLHAIVNQLAAALGVQGQVAAVRTKLQANAGTVQTAAKTAGITLPPASGELVIMRSSQLGAVQDFAGAIKGLALALPLITFVLFILAVALSRGHRRRSLRMTGWCFVAIGVFELLLRRLIGNDVVDALVKNPANRGAGHDVWTIATTLLYDIATALIAYGLVLVAAAWLGGHTRPARALRRALAPTLRDRPAVAYLLAIMGLLFLVLWGPTPATRQVAYIAGFAVLLAVGVATLRRETAAEFPDARPGDTMHSLHTWYSEQRHPGSAAVSGGPDSRAAGHLAELERLARLHERGSLTDAEFAAEKTVLMNGS